jgi:hypothetical protein
LVPHNGLSTHQGGHGCMFIRAGAFPIFIFACAATTLPSINKAHAGAKITVNYILVETEVSPEHKVMRSEQTRSYVLHDKNQIEFSGTGYNGSRHVLGEEHEWTTRDGRSYTASYHVNNGRFIVTTVYPHFISIRKIATDGKNKCSCMLTHLKKGGYKYFEKEKDSGIEYYSDIHAENMTCVVSQTAD